MRKGILKHTEVNIRLPNVKA